MTNMGFFSKLFGSKKKKRDRSRAKRGPFDQGMKLAKMVAKFQPAGRRMKPEEKLAWRERRLKDALARHGVPWRESFHEVLVDQMIKEEHRSNHARYVRAYGSYGSLGRDPSKACFFCKKHHPLPKTRPPCGHADCARCPAMAATCARYQPPRPKARDKKRKHRYEVIVGNIGTVVSTHDLEDARSTFNVYVEQSKSGRGRAAGEPVTLMKDGEMMKEFEGEYGERDRRRSRHRSRR
jgi:hypothetical protein